MKKVLIPFICLLSLMAFGASYTIFLISRTNSYGMSASQRTSVVWLVVLGIVTGVAVFLMVRRSGNQG